MSNYQTQQGTNAFSLAGKTIIATGAGSGFGRQAALQFAEAGAAVACLDLNGDAAHAVAEEIVASGGSARAFVADVSSADDVQGAVTGTVDWTGRIDALFASAGMSGHGTAASVAEEEWRRVIDVNLKGTWLCAKYVLPVMLEAGRGSIINVASIAALVGIKDNFSYTAAKGGVVAMTREMAADFGSTGVRVNVICPGTVPTALLLASRRAKVIAEGATDVEAAVAENLRRSAEAYPAGRLGTVQDIANIAVFLASDASQWVTGQTFAVDGGYTAV
ncbi:SDR family NAD(P)-dependent oxidoreductase [Streptomyces sp. GD-15H]|uniref:SDR family NAD(P)-dependent oxidoreductase n=1 Tax=Streptomyces sp. GD-15H TaxID=3129112 RepID=UPI003249BC73